MPIIDAIENYKAERDEDWAVYPVNQEAITREFNVKFTREPSEAGSRTALALASPLIPQKWQSHPRKPWTYVKNRVAVAGNGPLDIIVVVNYETQEDPINEPAVYEWLHNVSSEPKDTTVDNWAVVNSSGEAYDPPLNIDVYDQVLRVTKNETGFNAIYANSFIGTVNSTTFYGGPPGTVLCTMFSGRRSRAANLFYWVVVYEFQFRNDGWRRRVRDEGFRVRGNPPDSSSAGTTFYETIKDNEGNPLSQPALLDGYGQLLQSGRQPFFWYFDFHNRSNFGQLGV